MYPFLLGLHNILRWVVVVLAIYALYRSFTGLFSSKAWGSADRKAGMFLSMSLDIQFLVGLILYFVFSPLSKAFLANVGEAHERCQTALLRHGARSIHAGSRSAGTYRQQRR